MKKETFDLKKFLEYCKDKEIWLIDWQDGKLTGFDKQGYIVENILSSKQLEMFINLNLCNFSILVK